jgi:LmbE family N-acetylglucosaminyl deacetylase
VTEAPEPGSKALHALAQLADSRRPEIDASRMAAVLAHPDDETLGLGAQLRRMRGLRLVLVTDGAPRNLADARAHGFEDAAAYAAARRGELQAALREGGAEDLAVTYLDAPDQGAAADLAALARRLAAELAGVEVVFTHAYEGGHPDHDATAFAAHAAARLLAVDGAAPEIVEAPFYRLGDDGEMLAQDFAPEPGLAPVQLVLGPEEAARKTRMMGAHATQRATLARFEARAERFRMAPDYDFTRAPNGGRVLYERFPWGMTAGRFAELAARASRELGFGADGDDAG